jgi:hypothetical protein
VKKGWSIAYGKKHMPKPKELLEFGERWRPYRTVASWYMWRAFERAGYKVTNKIHPRPAHKRKSRKRRGKGSNGKSEAPLTGHPFSGRNGKHSDRAPQTAPKPIRKHSFHQI